MGVFLEAVALSLALKDHGKRGQPGLEVLTCGEGHSSRSKCLEKNNALLPSDRLDFRESTHSCVYVNTACFRCKKFSQYFVTHKML